MEPSDNLGITKYQYIIKEKKIAALAFSRWIAASAKISTKTLVVEWLKNIKPVRIESNDSFFLKTGFYVVNKRRPLMLLITRFLSPSISVSIVHIGKKYIDEMI